MFTTPASQPDAALKPPWDLLCQASQFVARTMWLADTHNQALHQAPCPVNLTLAASTA